MHRLLATSILLLVFASSAPAQHMAFRISNLDLRDPHTHAVIFILGCRDITDTAPFGATSFNESLDDAMNNDVDGDGDLDLNGLIVFLDTQTAVGTGPDPTNDLGVTLPETGEVVAHFGTCTAPVAGTICSPSGANPIQRTNYSTVDPCLVPYSGTTSGYSPSITAPGPPCFNTDRFELLLDLAGLPVTLEDAQISGTLVGNPPSMIMDGLIAGFMPEAVADTVIIPENVSNVGGEPLSSILPGGSDCCAGHDDRDLSLDASTVGWWAYFNFEAEFVPLDASTAAALGPVATPKRLVRLGPPIPNPFPVETSLSFVLPQRNRVTITVVDAAGRRVSTLRSRSYEAGAHTVSWNGTDASGRLVGSGVYFVRLETSLGGQTKKVVFTH